MKPVRALMITDSGIFGVGEINAELEPLQALVGGSIECVTLDAKTHMYCDEEGKLNHKPINRVATLLAEHFRPGFTQHDVMVGDVVILGSTPSGNEGSVPQRVIDLVASLPGASNDPDEAMRR